MRRRERRPKRGRGKFLCYLAAKRAFDIIFSSAALVCLAPVILLAMLAKWLEDFENPVYVSTRVGRDGRFFRFYKIRTMVVGAEEMKQRLIDEGKNEADGPVFKMKEDPRVTRVGKFLRKFSIDELPQLLNVLNGTMSLVGPRPPLPQEAAQYTEAERKRLEAKGGLLCLWQIKRNRNSLPFGEWLRLDLDYIARRSFLLDLKILLIGAFMVIFDHSGE